MELRHLRYFVAVAEEQSVTRAAVRLHVSQPPLSRQIQDLEEELGVELFRRTANSMHLTDAGRRFQIEAAKVLRQADRAINAMANEVKDQQAELKVGYSPIVSADLLSTAMRRFRKEVPRARVKLIDLPGQELLAAMVRRNIDAALIVQPRVNLPRRLRFDPVRRYRGGVLVPRGHALASRETIELADIGGAPLVALSAGAYTNYHHFLRSTFRKMKTKPRIAQECGGQSSLLAAIASGYGIAVMFEMPKRLRPGIHFVPFKSGVEPMTVGVLYRTGEKSARLAAFLSAVKSSRSKDLESSIREVTG